jgi:RNA polymerase sigma-70 factor (ECF subfamily)
MTTHDFTQVVDQYYEPLYRFAFSLARAEADACDLTQQTFYIWATKGNQLRDGSKIKSWLFTTLRREFLSIRRKYSRLEYSESIDEEEELAVVSPDLVNSLDAARLVELLQQVKEPYRSAITLFYLEDFSYREIAGILGVPIGTVQSRISRGVGQLQRLIFSDGGLGQCRPLPEPGTAKRGSQSARREVNWDWTAAAHNPATC